MWVAFYSVHPSLWALKLVFFVVVRMPDSWETGKRYMSCDPCSVPISRYASIFTSVCGCGWGVWACMCGWVCCALFCHHGRALYPSHDVCVVRFGHFFGPPLEVKVMRLEYLCRSTVAKAVCILIQHQFCCWECVRSIYM